MLDLLDLQDPLDLEDLMVAITFKDPLDHKEPQDLKDLLVLKDPQEPQVSLE